MLLSCWRNYRLGCSAIVHVLVSTRIPQTRIHQRFGQENMFTMQWLASNRPFAITLCWSSVSPSVRNLYRAWFPAFLWASTRHIAVHLLFVSYAHCSCSRWQDCVRMLGYVQLGHHLCYNATTLLLLMLPFCLHLSVMKRSDYSHVLFGCEFL